MLDDEINDILEKLDVGLTTLELRCKFCGKMYDFEKERQLRLLAKELINETKKLKEGAEHNKNKLLSQLLDGETKIFKSLTDLEYEKINALHNIVVLESKLIKPEISPARINRIKNSDLLSAFMSL